MFGFGDAWKNRWKDELKQRQGRAWTIEHLSCATPKRALSNRGSSQIFGEVRSATDSPGQQPARLSVLRGSLDRRRLQSRARSWRLRGCADASALFRTLPVISYAAALFHELSYGTGQFHGCGQIPSRDNRARERERERERRVSPGDPAAADRNLAVVVVNETSTRSSEMKLIEETRVFEEDWRGGNWTERVGSS